MLFSCVKIPAIFVFLFTILFFSCSSGANIDLSSGSDETLKQYAEKKESNILWTTEIESNRLNRSIKTSSSVSSALKLSPEIIALSESNPPVYPVLEGFSSLDTSLLSNELSEYLEKICKSISNWTLSSSEFSDGSDFAFTLFKYDLTALWEENNKEAFPSGEEINLFESWLFGEPFIDDGEIQIPVRFSNKKCNTDILFYVNQTKGFKIDQIIIQKMEKR